MPLELAKAEALAQRIVAALQPFCTRIDIAGSIRRRRALVNDIDIVALPKPGELLNFCARAKQATEVVKDGPQNMILRLKNGVQLDIFIAHPEFKELLETRATNYGSLLLSRTGSIAHNIYLVEHAKDIGLTWNPYVGVIDDEFNIIAAAEEADIFRALKLDFIPPEQRER